MKQKNLITIIKSNSAAKQTSSAVTDLPGRGYLKIKDN
jgi:hypothetical protein